MKKYFHYFRIALILFMLSGISYQVIAQSFSFLVRDNNRKHTAEYIKAHTNTGTQLQDTIIVTQDKWLDMAQNPNSWMENYTFKSIHSFVKFSVNHNYAKKINTPYTLRLAYTLVGYDNPADTVNSYQIHHDTLTISYSPDSLATYQDIQVRKYPGYSKVIIVLNTLYQIPGGGNPPVAVDMNATGNFSLLNFDVEGAIVVQPYIKKVGSKSWYGSDAEMLNIGSEEPVNNYMEVRWNLPGSNLNSPLEVFPAAYELEWTYIDDYKVDPETGVVSYIPKSGLEYDFKHNSTRIWLDTNYYRIPIVYQHGYIVYRVRMVRPDSVHFRYPVYSPWSLPEEGAVSSVSSSGIRAVSTSYMQDSLNWQYTVSFAEQGKFKHVLSFYDGLLKNRQSITRFNSSPGLLIATDQIYDYEGHPSISILPTPIPTADFRYQPSLALSMPSGMPYHASDFDGLNLTACPQDVIPPALSDNSFANIYYSPLNPDKSGAQKFVPDAGGYPFTATLFSPGYADRVDKQGGAGDKLQIGTGREVKNNYVGEDQMNLNRLFGPEIGWSGFYRKTVSRDPNGQLSINVSDFQGKTVMSSMVGIPDTTELALMPNTDVPQASTYQEDFIAGTTQQVIGNKIILDKNFFNEEGFNTQANYNVVLRPFPTGCPDKFLTVKVNYDYKVFNECGEVEGSGTGDIAQTSLLTNGNPISFNAPVSNFFMDKGAHTLHKELTINMQDVQEAVDLFMDSPDNCLKTEREFIKEAVLSKTFPCPDDGSGGGDPCAEKKLKMMKELWPNVDSVYAARKYGVYRRINNIVVGNANSIFTIYDDDNGNVILIDEGTEGGGDENPDREGYFVFDGQIFKDGMDTVSFHYRYQDDCLVRLPDTVWYMGHPYTNLKELSVDTFIMIFNDEIAAALLPLHPEYCALLNCGRDEFAQKMQSIPDAATAEGLGLLRLIDIIEADPLYTAMLSNPAYPSAMDTLAYFLGGTMSLDTLAINQAWCECGNANMYQSCLNHIFQEPIADGLLDNDYVKERYFEQIVPLYLANRQRYLSNLTAGMDIDCNECIESRMTLVEPPVFMQVFNNSGGLATGPGSFYGTALNVNGSAASSFNNWNQYINNFTESQVEQYSDSAQYVYSGMNDTLGLGAINMIIAQLVNCADSLDLVDVRDTLVAMLNRNEVLFGNFSPDQIRYALVVNGIDLNDLCNPYLINYDGFGPSSGLSGVPFSCLNESFYSAATAFLQGVPLTALGNPGTAYSVTLSANAFTSKLIDVLGTTAAQVEAAYDATNKLYTLYIYETNPTDVNSVRIYFQDGNAGTCQQAFQPSAGETIQLQVSCIKDVPNNYFNGLANGYVGTYAFAAVVTHISNGQTTTCLLPGWTDKVPMSKNEVNSIASAVPPTQMRDLYQQFWDTLEVYQVKGIDHPYYRTMLRNFMNYKLDKVYTAGQYESYIESCALADFMDIPKYYSYAKLGFASPANAQTFINAVSNLDANVLLQPVYYNETTSRVAYDFRHIPLDKLRIYKNYMQNYSGPGLNEVSVNEPLLPFSNMEMGRLLVPASSSFVPNPSVIYAGSSFAFTMPLISSYTISLNDNPAISYKMYDILAPSGATKASNSYNLYLLQQYLTDNNLDGYLISLREHTVGPEYDLPHKQAYLDYAYASQNLSPSRVLDTLQTPHLGATPDFVNNLLQYGHAMAPGDLQNLYVLDQATATGANTQYDILEYIMNEVAGNLQGNLFFHTVDIKNIPSNNLLTAYRSSEHVYWFRYFDPDNYLFNVFIPVPEYLDSIQLAGYEYVGMEVLPGEGSSRAFSLVMHNPAMPNPELRLTGYTDFTIASNEVLHDVLLYPGLADQLAMPDTVDNCERLLLKAAIYEGKVAYQHYIDSTRNALYNGLMAWLTQGNIEEKLLMEYSTQRFNYTLYYYDRAGNLMRTVPPAGVSFLANTSLSQVDQARTTDAGAPALYPAHKKVSSYRYNTLNQVVNQNTPDGGNVQYFYDAAGRVVFSQNEKQRPTGNMTYTLYDEQGRIIETGEVKIACPWFYMKEVQVFNALMNMVAPLSSSLTASPSSSPLNPSPYPYPCAYFDPNTNQYTPYPPIVYNLKHETQQDVVDYVRSLARSEVVETTYDEPAVNLENMTGMSAQENLRQRVASIKYYDYLPAGSHPNSYTYAMHFSYDVAGNVKTLTRDYPAWKSSGQQFKRIDYDYDLISGKVNLLSYNRSFADQYFQRYQYDDDNRIVSVETSADGYIWRQDARYEYYQHGPLARMELGEEAVQGVDYAYTIQGWLKAVNSDLLSPEKDMGGDSRGASAYANDAMGYSIDYFKGDYNPIGTDSVSFLPQAQKSLFNGNISRTNMALLPFEDLSTRYTYDQLNRILKADYAKVSPAGALTNTADYYSSYSYDADGNLNKLVRNGNKPAQIRMDSLMYHYTPGNTNNQLLNINDYAADNYSNDIKQNTATGVYRYMYDQTGNVIKDLVSGQDTIVWNHYNKVIRTRKDDLGNGLEFAYDGAGHRYMKAVTSTDGDTSSYDQEYTVRDAQGNALAIYRGQSVYNTERRDVWIRLVLDDILVQEVKDNMLRSYLATAYGQDGHFKNSILSASAEYPDWVGSVLNSNDVSWYMMRNNAVLMNMLAHTGDYADFYSALADYTGDSGNADGPILGNSLDSLFYADEGAFHDFLYELLSSEGVDDALRMAALTKLCDVPELLSWLADRLGIPNEPEECESTITQLNDFVRDNGSEDIAVFLIEFLQDDASGAFFEYINLIATDVDLMGNPVYTGAEGVLLQVFQHALMDYCPPWRISGFMDTWGASRDMLMSTNDHQTLLSVVYDDDPAEYLSDFVVTAQGGDLQGTVNALSAITWLTPSDLINQAEVYLVYSPSATLYQEILKYQRIYLSSHVLYGSSRLGTKDYAPGQLYSLIDYQGAQPVKDTVLLRQRRPWYSAEYQDAIASTALEPWDRTQKEAFSMTEMTGDKQYELTNHLGNVMATVSDNKYAYHNLDGEVMGWHPALRTAYDYYPFGMLMPGRYVSDTTENCITVTRSKWEWRWEEVCWGELRVWPDYVGQGDVVLEAQDVGLWMRAPNPTDGIGFSIEATPNEAQEVRIDFSAVALSENSFIQVMEQHGGDWVPLGEVEVVDASVGSASLQITPTADDIMVYWWGAGEVYITRLCYKTRKWVEVEELVTICDGDGDKYRFGYNTQEKVNEIAGIGNHYTALHWEYDSRLGRRWNLDPVKDHSQSSYATFNNNPIFNTDHLGNVGEPVVKDGQLTIYSHILFYGGAANAKLANQAANNIQTQWTNANGTVTFQGKEYTNVQFVVTSEVVSEKVAQFRAESNRGDNYNPRLNFARIESKENLPDKTANRVVGHWGGDNSMFLIAEDIYEGNTSQSHEMGHGFGIGKHISSFERFKGVPRIMTTIHTLVDAEFTDDGKASELKIENGKKSVIHPLNRDNRRVTQDDINDIKIMDYRGYNKGQGLGNGFRVGNSSNTLFDNQGKPINEE